MARKIDKRTAVAYHEGCHPSDTHAEAEATCTWWHGGRRLAKL